MTGGAVIKRIDSLSEAAFVALRRATTADYGLLRVRCMAGDLGGRWLAAQRREHPDQDPWFETATRCR